MQLPVVIIQIQQWHLLRSQV
jgi:hypothetical protein